MPEMMPSFHYLTLEATDPRLEDVFRLRYQVYCLECGYEDASAYPDRMESDEYDARAVHFCALEEHSHRLVGTARIILPSDRGLPVFNHFPVDPELMLSIPTDRAGEISRLAISKDYRRRLVDQVLYDGTKVIDFLDQREKRSWRRRYENELVSGLYRHIYEESVNLDLTHLFGILSDGMSALLTRWGMSMRPAGPHQDFHGLRRPYVATVRENLDWFEKRYSSYSSVG